MIQKVQYLIVELRNRRNVEENWKEFYSIINTNKNALIKELNIRWIISICDTIVDYADEPQRSKALVLVTFVSMIKFSETIKYIRPNVSEKRLKTIMNSTHTLYEGLDVFSVNNQDVLLNLSKRMDDILKDDELLYDFWKIINKRLLNNNSVITDFSKKSNKPHRYFPSNPRKYPDNYGVK